VPGFCTKEGQRRLGQLGNESRFDLVRKSTEIFVLLCHRRSETSGCKPATAVEVAVLDKENVFAYAPTTAGCSRVYALYSASISRQANADANGRGVMSVVHDQALSSDGAVLDRLVLPVLLPAGTEESFTESHHRAASKAGQWLSAALVVWLGGPHRQCAARLRACCWRMFRIYPRSHRNEPGPKRLPSRGSHLLQSRWFSEVGIQWEARLAFAA
jgi:hypothetical protein